MPVSRQVRARKVKCVESKIMTETSGLQDRTPDGEFGSFGEWVDKAASWIGGTNPLCADAKGRVCEVGKDFMRARDEGAFPIRFWYGEGKQTKAQQRKSRRAAEKLLPGGAFKLRARTAFYGI